MKKIWIVVIAGLLFATGCTKSDTETYKGTFKEYADTLISESVGSKSLTNNLSFNDPSAFGISVENAELGFSTEEDYKNSTEEIARIIKTLKSFDDGALSKQEQLDRDALIAYFETELESEKYYYFIEGENIGSSRSMNLQLPFYLDIFDLRDQESLDSYFHFIETLAISFEKYADLETKRQELKMGLSQKEIDVVKESASQTATAARTDDYFLIASFNRKIDAVSFLSEQEKEAAKSKNVKALNETFATAFQQLSDAYADIKGTELMGLSDKAGGKAYYEYLFRKSTGSSLSIREVKKILGDRKNRILKSLVSYQMANPENVERFQSDTVFDGMFTDIYAVIGAINAAMVKDFPAIEMPNYDVRLVDESQRKTASPAFYFSPKVDAKAEDVQFIYVNGDFDNNDYTTYAHEGIPGHMYQFNYFKQSDAHPIRSLLSLSANAEGWANYTENYALKYVLDEDFSQFIANYAALINMMHIELDIGINYEGWDMQEMMRHIEEFGFSVNANAAPDLYLSFVQNPAVYPTYYVSSMYIEMLKENAKDQWGSDYSDYRFHQEFLDSGSTTFDVIAKHMGLELKR